MFVSFAASAPRARTWRAVVAACLLLSATAPPAHAQPAAGTWATSVEESGTRYLRYSATVPLLGKPTAVTVAFFCNPTRSANANGTLGFELHILKIAPLSSFHFSDFEGPDAEVPGRPLSVTVTRPGAAPLSLGFAPNGSTPDEGQFAFGVADLSHVASTEKTLLQALAAGAESVRIVVSDSRNPQLKLDLAVPVAGTQAAFQTLLTGVK
jgi:hypothetical protein